MKYSVFHKSLERNVATGHFQYERVALVEAESLEHAFMLTSNVDGSWTTYPGVTTNLTDCRSTSIGDIIRDEADQSMYEVVPVGGFRKVVLSNA